MNKYCVAALAGAAILPAAPAAAQEVGLEPYVAVMGTIHDFDSETHGEIPNRFGGDGRLVEGIAGVNVPVGDFFVGAEGNVAKGVDGDMDWEYGVAGRAGVRVGDSGMFYGRVGYLWVNFDDFGGQREYDDIVYGAGVEIGPEEIGLAGVTGESGIRLRAEIQTYGDFESIRPSVGVVAHF